MTGREWSWGIWWGGHSAGSGQVALAGPTWGPSLSGGRTTFPDPLAEPVVCPPVQAPGLCGQLGSGVEPLQWKSLMDPAGWGSRGSCWHPSHPAPPGTNRTGEALTKGDSTSFGPNPEICFPGSLFIEPPSPHWGRSVIHTLSGVYNSFIKFRAGRGFNSE